MIALDTNILVRCIVDDDHAQQRQAARLLADERQRFFVGDTVLAEFVWVLDSICGYGREDIASAIEAMLHRSDMVFEDEVRIRRAARWFLEGGDFADGLILGRAESAGCTALATFDKALKKRFGNLIITPS